MTTPDVVSEKKSRSNRQKISQRQRTRIFERDGFTCQRCGAKAGAVRVHVDHIIPVARGGLSVDWNLQTLCEPCNLSKSDREPTQHDTHGPLQTLPTLPIVVSVESSSPPATTPQHPLAGKYCHKTGTGEVVRYGWNWNYQARIDSIVGDHALVQYFSALDGGPADIKPVALTELLGGTWIFYASRNEWIEAGSAAMERYWDGKHAERNSGLELVG